MYPFQAMNSSILPGSLGILFNPDYQPEKSESIVPFFVVRCLSLYEDGNYGLFELLKHSWPKNEIQSCHLFFLHSTAQIKHISNLNIIQSEETCTVQVDLRSMDNYHVLDDGIAFIVNVCTILILKSLLFVDHV